MDAQSVELLAAYDEQLRTAAEVRDATEVQRFGPLWIARFGTDQLFVTYRELDDPKLLVEHVAELLTSDPTITQAEWKTRSHDVAPGLEAALAAAGFIAGETESVMLGEAAGLVNAQTPPGVTLRPLTDPEEMRAALYLQDRVFESSYAERMLPELMQRQANGDPLELWVAEADGRMVSTGRIDPIAGTEFAGIWGGVTLPEYRGRGIYRALTAARVRSAMQHGVRWIHSDSTEFSRPILERSGLVKVTETIPWTWERASGDAT